MMNRHLPERQRAFQPEATAFAKHRRRRIAQPLGENASPLGWGADRQKIRLKRVFHPKEFGICPKEKREAADRFKPFMALIGYLTKFRLDPLQMEDYLLKLTTTFTRLNYLAKFKSVL